MKKYSFYGGLLIILLLISTGCSSSKLIAKNQSPSVERASHTQAVISAAQATLNKKYRPLFQIPKKYKSKIIALLGLLWLWLLTKFYITEKNRRIPRWRLEDLALLKIIKANALRLWNNQRPDKKIISLVDWRG